MTLSEWLDARVADSPNTSREHWLRRVHELSGVSLGTLRPVSRGARMGRYDKAKAIELATGGAVTARELCDAS